LYATIAAAKYAVIETQKEHADVMPEGSLAVLGVQT
jgi:hypothetical protein